MPFNASFLRPRSRERGAMEQGKYQRCCQNGTMRMHMRRLTRRTNASSKKFENFRAAVAVRFAYDNFMRFRSPLRMSPARNALDAGRA